MQFSNLHYFMPERLDKDKNKDCKRKTFQHAPPMSKKQTVPEAELASLAKEFRLKSGRTKIEAAAELGVTRSTVQNAEENPVQSLTRARIRMIEAYSPYKVSGPYYRLERK